MLRKQVSFAVLVVTLIAGGAAVANAESNIHGSSSGTTGAFASGPMEDDWAASQAPGWLPTKGSLPDEGAFTSAGMDTYGYAAPPQRHFRKGAKTKHRH